MKRLLLIGISLISMASLSFTAPQKELTINEKIAINNLKDHVTYRRKEVVAKQIKYPLTRCSYFDYYIKDQKDFINSFDIIFDVKQIDDFRTRNFELQTSGDCAFDKLEAFEKEYEGFRENVLVDEFLAAELAFCRMMQEINIRITEAMQFD